MKKITIVQLDDMASVANLVSDVDAIFDVRRHYGLFTRSAQYQLVEKINDFALQLSFELDTDITIVIVQLPAHQNFAFLLGELLSMNGSHVVLDGA